jgi:Fe2+ or Zn2+ uptake regulation protein
MRSPDELTSLFRAHGLKVTPQRLAVFEALHHYDSHPTAGHICDRVREGMPTVSLRTVYQVLNDLTDLGEVQPVVLDGGPARFDPNTDDHDHFVCHRCDRVFDVVASRPNLLVGPAGGGLESPSANGSSADGSSVDGPAGFKVETAEVIFRGLCPSCQG